MSHDLADKVQLKVRKITFEQRSQRLLYVILLTFNMLLVVKYISKMNVILPLLKVTGVG